MENLEDEMVSRAKWLYAYNAGAIPMKECVEKAFKEYGSKTWFDSAIMFEGVDRSEYLRGLTNRCNDSLATVY